MGVYQFLAGLPALLGVAGFFAYLWAGQSRVGGEIFKQIVAKLRTAPNLDITQYSSLTPARIGKLIESDSRVRDVVNEQDRKLLTLLIIFQHALTVIVLLVCAGLIAVSVWLVARPQPLSVAVGPPTAVEKDAGGLLVDTDPVMVQWSATGRAEPVSVYLENVDAGSKTAKKELSSDIRSIVFKSAELAKVAVNRGYHQSNRIRSVVEWSTNRSVSEVKNLLVGIDVELMLNGHLIMPNGKERTIHTLMASIDQATASLPADYCFSGDLVGWTSSNPIVIPLRSCNSDTEVVIPGLETIDWNRRVGFVYHGQDDSRIVRAHVSGGYGGRTNGGR